MVLQDRNMVLHGNPVTVVDWEFALLLKKIPAWLRTLEKVVQANLEYCDVKEMKKGAFPESLEDLVIHGQRIESGGLRLHPDSFEGLPNLQRFEGGANKLNENDMHPGLFAGATSLRHLQLCGNPEIRKFAASELFPGGSNIMSFICLNFCGVSEGTDFQGLPNLETLDVGGAVHLPSRLFSGLCSLDSLLLDGVQPDAWGDDTFVGTTRCDSIHENVCARQACNEQADVDSESKCECQRNPLCRG